jgi:hypothetical protein
MKQDGQFLLFTREEFRDWIFKNQFRRLIKMVQNHHTYSPDYNAFNNNHFALLKSMKDYHVNQNGYADIAQNLTTFPDGLIAVCRDFEKAPAGIYGANTSALCIEHVGNFDKDIITAEHKKTIVFLNAILCTRFGLQPSTNTIIYHHWYDLNTGKRTTGGVTKTCPGKLFFGGNTIEACQQNFIPLVIAEMKGESDLDWKDIIKKVLAQPQDWENAIQTAVNAAKADGDLGALEIFQFLPELIIKVYNAKGA